LDQRDPGRLFQSLAAEFSRYLAEQRSQLEREILVFPAAEADRLGQALFSSLSTGGFCTLVVTGRGDWDPRSHYHEAARFAAKRGCKILRTFLLPHRHCRHDPSLREHLQLDEAAGITTRILHIGDLLSSLTLPLADTLDFGIWDDSVGCIGVGSSGPRDRGIAEWRVTSRADYVQTLLDIKGVLESQGEAVSLTNQPPPTDLEEPMITTAPIAHELAGVLCQGDHVSPEDCSWYHSVWQYLRIFNMVSTPTWHSRFYLDFLAGLAKRDFSRVLVSGTADYSMLAHLLAAFASTGRAPDVTVLDLCETPLFLCKWYGKSVGTRVSTVAADILQYSANETFDIVVTDAFLTRFPDAERDRLVQQWFRLLRSGGRVVTTVRIEPGLSRPQIQATSDQADSFRRRAEQEARRWQGFLRCSPTEIAVLAQRYAERMVSYSFETADAVRALFTRNNFEIEHAGTVAVPGEMASTTYVELVASRP